MCTQLVPNPQERRPHSAQIFPPYCQPMSMDCASCTLKSQVTCCFRFLEGTTPKQETTVRPKSTLKRRPVSRLSQSRLRRISEVRSLTLSFSPRRGHHPTPSAHTPVAVSSRVTMSTSQMNELSKQGEDDVDPRERQGLLEEQLLGVEEKEAVSFSSSLSSSSSALSDSPEEVAAVVASSPSQSLESACPSPTAREAVPLSRTKKECPSNVDEEGRSSREDPEDAESSQKEALRLKMVDLVAFLLLKYHTKEPTTKSEMLSRIIKKHQDHFPEIFCQASQCLRLLFGIEVKEVDPSNDIYFLGTTLGLTYDGGHCLPKTGLLITLLCLILLEGDCAPEEEIWKSLNVMGLYDGREHCIYGEPRELITSVWVREQYVVYHQVANSDPARYEFLWGPRAHAETSRLKVLEYLFSLKCKSLLSEEAQSNEEEEA